MSDLETIEFFWSRVAKTPTCWNWTGTKVKGYGHVRYGDIRQYAHRFAWELFHGPISHGLIIDHMCHNPACVRVDHLRTVDHTANMQNRQGAHSNSKSGIRGVSWDPRRRLWCAEVKASKRRYFKRFETADEADRWARSLRASLHISTPTF